MMEFHNNLKLKLDTFCHELKSQIRLDLTFDVVFVKFIGHEKTLDVHVPENAIELWSEMPP